MFSQLPAVFARYLTQNPFQIGQRPAAWLGASKAWSNTSMQVNQSLNPTTDIGGGRSISTTGDMLIVLHDLLLFHEHVLRMFCPSSMSHAQTKVMKFLFTWKKPLYGSAYKV